MILPDQPATFRQPSADERPWWWRLEDAAGQQVDAPADYADARFPTQSEAESWLGEVFADLADAGVDGVTLFELERPVYGPMSLHP